MRIQRWALLGCISFLASCASQAKQTAASPEPAAIEITGTPGAQIRGFFVIGGKRSEFSGTVPFTLKARDLMVIAIAKAKDSDEITCQVQANRGTMSMGLKGGEQQALVMEVGGGLSGYYQPAEAIQQAAGDVIVIKPYWHEDTWVFDDAATGLKGELFVRGIPAMINRLVKDIPDAQAGFKLTASEKPFEGWQHKMTWVREDDGGNIYRMDDPALEGWLCPALFRYFDHAPKLIYVKAEKL